MTIPTRVCPLCNAENEAIDNCAFGKCEMQTERQALDSAIAVLLDETPEEEEAWRAMSQTS